MNCEDTTIQPWVNSTENASSSRDESSPIRDTNDNGRADRRNARSPPAVQPTAGAGSSRGESPGRAEDETSDSGEFELERKMFELERRKVEIEIALAQCVLARKRCRERATQAVRGQQTGDIDPMLRDLAANMAEVGVNGVREHGGCTAMAANRQRHPRATRMEDSGATRQPETIAPLTAVGYPGLLNATLATIAPLTAAEQLGPSHTTAAATDHYEPEYISWRRAVDERYRLGSTNCTTHGRAMEGDNAGVRDEDGADTRTRKHFDSIGHCYTHSGLDGVLLRYVPVVLHGRGTNVQTFALLDDGSTSTFMDHDLMGELGLRGTLRPLCLNWTGDTVREEVDSVEVDIEISGVHDAAATYKLPKVHTVRSLSLPAQTISMKLMAQQYGHLRNVPASSYVCAKPRILIGVEHCHLFKPLKYKEGRWGDPVATKTRLGWTVFGPVPRPAVPVDSHVCFTTNAVEMGSSDLDAALRAHFSLESIGIIRPSRPLRSKDEERAEELLRKRTQLLVRRYETGLLWKHDDVKLPPSREMALRRHECLKKKLRRNTELATAMIEKMEEYEAKGYIRRLTASEVGKRGPRDWYLPIFPVTNPNKPGKIRVVFDAAAKAHGTSLNDRLLTGPDQLASLVGVLRQFREGRVAVVGDIKEMFFQVRMRPEDQQSQRFVWLSGSNLDDETCTFVVTVMTFGAACSPSSAQYVKNINADRFAAKFPRAVDCIKQEHYVDDMLASVETEDEALTLAREVRYIHAQGGFEIRNWVSNSKRVVRQLHQEKGDEQLIEMRSDSPAEKVLELWWDTAKDIFTFRVSPR